VCEPPAVVLWLATGRRRTSIRAVRFLAGVLAILLMLGPSAVVAPTLAAGQSSREPPPISGTGLSLEPVSATDAERLLQAPLLDGPDLHGPTRHLGLWSAVVDGPFGHTAVVFQTYSTSRQTWFTVLQVRSERPMTESAWQIVLAQPVTVNGKTAHLFARPGSTTVSWQPAPTLSVSFTEDIQQAGVDRVSPDWSKLHMLDQDTFLQAAASLHPRGMQLGPFHLDTPW